MLKAIINEIPEIKKIVTNYKLPDSSQENPNLILENNVRLIINTLGPTIHAS